MSEIKTSIGSKKNTNKKARQLSLAGFFVGISLWLNYFLF
jgi:hypothetical protein